MKNKILLTFFILFSVITIFLFCKIKYQEDILVMLPSSLSNKMELFQKTPFSNKLFVVITSKDSSNLNESIKIVQEKLKDFSDTISTKKIDKDFILSYYYYLPYLWNSDLENKVSNLLTKETLEETKQNNLMMLFSPEGTFFKDFITIDPINMLKVALEDLKILNFSNSNLSFVDGCLINEQQNMALLLYDTNKNNFDRNQAVNITKTIEDINKFLPQESSVFSLGASRYTKENNEIIVKDVTKILIISIFLIILVFLFLFRDKSAIFIYTIPIFVLIPASVFTYLKFNFLSGITLGFGSVLMGLAVDYSIYVYYAFKSSNTNIDKKILLKTISKPIILSALTSILSFFVLYFCDILLFKQLAYFAIFGLVYAMFIAFFISPIFYKLQNKKISTMKLPKSINYKFSIFFVIATIVLGIFCFNFVEVDTSLESLNTVSPKFVQDRKIFDNLTNYNSNKNSMLFVIGNNREETLTLSNEISQEKKLDILKLLPTQEQKQKNLEMWKKFWDDKKVSYLKNDINLFFKSYGIKELSFENFYNFLSTAQKPNNVEDFDITQIYNPFVILKDKVAMVHFVDANFKLPEKFQNNKNIILLSKDKLQKELSQKTINNILVVTLFVFIFDFMLLLLTFKNIKVVLTSFIPILVTISVIIILYAIFSIKINLFSLFCLPLIIGLSIDYAIFIIHQNTLSTNLYPSIAVIAASLSSLAGFGSLIFAQHKVLFSIGSVLSVGIIVSSLVSVYILPNIIKKIVKILPLFLVMFLVSCSTTTPKITYNNISQESSYTQTQNYQGELYNKIFFTSVISKIDEENYRIVTLNEFGIKLLDSTISCENVNINYKVNFLPKKLAKELSIFYNDFLFNKYKLIENNKILYNNSKTISFWSQNEFGN